MTRGRMLVIATVAFLAAAGAASVLLLAHGQPRAETPSVGVRDRAPGVAALSALRLLLSAHGRQALAPKLGAALPHHGERLFPARSTFTPTAGSWHQAGAYASLAERSASRGSRQ